MVRLIGKVCWRPADPLPEFEVFPLEEAGEGVNNLALEEDCGDARETAPTGPGMLLSTMRTPDGPSTIPKVEAARIKYCIVVPVLLVLFAFKAASVSFKF